MSYNKLDFNESKESFTFTCLEDCYTWLASVSQDPACSSPQIERALSNYLINAGEISLAEFYQAVLTHSNVKQSNTALPQVNPAHIPEPGYSRSESGHLFSIPSTLEIFEQERLRLLSLICVQKALGRRIVVNVGIGYIGTANVAAAASATDEDGEPAYFVIAYQRPSVHSSWKVDVMNQGLPTISTSDSSLGIRINSAIQRGNLTATFLHDEAIAFADLIFVETELHVRKFNKRAIERSEADPEATLELLGSIATVMQHNATVIIESTVYPGFTLHDALPLCNDILQKRGLCTEHTDANLAYSFHRVKPGPQFMESFFNLQREAGAVNSHASSTLQEYFDNCGINYRWESEITAVELTKDIENAAKYGLLDLMSAFLKAAEVAGVDGYRIIRNIAEARPDDHGRFIDNVAGLQVGGYCVPKELGLLMNGLRRHFSMSELALREMFYSRIASSSVSDHRAEDAAFIILEALAENNIPITESKLYWAGVSYKEGVGDTRMAGTERGLRYAAHLGASNRVTDPRVVNWPELQNQSLGDPECWGHGLLHQAQLRDIRVQLSDDPAKHLRPQDDAVILAVRHPSYIGSGKPDEEREEFIDGRVVVHGGTDAVSLSSQVLGLENKVILDCYDFLSDQDIKAFIALGWTVRAFGKGHVDKLSQQLTCSEKIQHNEQLLESLKKRLQRADDHKNAIDVEEAITVISAKLGYLRCLLLQTTSPDTIIDARLNWLLLRTRQSIRFAEPTARKHYEKILASLENLPTPVNEDELEKTLAISMNQTRTDTITKGAIDRESQQLFARIRQTGELLTAIARQAPELRQPKNSADASRLLQSLRYLKYAGLDGLQQDMDRLVYELMPESSSIHVAGELRKIRERTELHISEQDIEHPLFDSKDAPLARLRPATVFVTDNNGKLGKIEDPTGVPFRYSTKWVPDLKKLLEDRNAFPVEWTKFSMDVPVNLARAAEGSISYDLYDDFLYLPLEFREWIVKEVWDRGFVLTTMEGERQDKIGYLMDVNLDPKTIARGRGGVLFWKDSRQPVVLTSPGGQEIPLDIKAIGDYRGGSAENLNVNYNRTIISGRVEGGGTAKTNLGQVPGHMYSADDINWQERCKTMGEYHSGYSPRSVFRAQWSYRDKPAETFQMIGRASPSTLRLGHVMAGTDTHDMSPAECARILGWNNAEVLAHDISAVHIAMNLDNVMSNGYYTDMGSNIDLYTERDPRGTFRDYGGYGILMVIYTYAGMKAFQQGSSELPTADVENLQDWFDGFLTRFFEIPHVKQTTDPLPFQPFFNIAERVDGNPDEAEALIDEWLDVLWRHFLPYHLLRNRISYGYNAEQESPFTTGREERMHDVYDKQKAITFLLAQQELINGAFRIQEENEKELDFDFEAALYELDKKLSSAENQADGDFSEYYQLSFYKPVNEDVHTVLDAKSPGRLVISRAHPTIFIDKMEANINQRMRLGGLRITRMMEKIDSDGGVYELIQAYADVWKGPASHLPGEYDIQQQEGAEALLRLVRKDLQMAGLLEQTHFKRLEDIHWLPIQAAEDAVQSGFQHGNTTYRFTLKENGDLILFD